MQYAQDEKNGLDRLCSFFFFREEKNVALAELRDELLASKKGLEALRQEVNKKYQGLFQLRSVMDHNYLKLASHMFIFF